MELNKTLITIQTLMEERNWTLYKLAKESNIPYSSLNSLFQKNNQPTLTTLEKICQGFHISMAEFFSENPPYRIDSYSFSSDEIELIEMYRAAGKQEKKILLAYMKGYLKRTL